MFFRSFSASTVSLSVAKPRHLRDREAIVRFFDARLSRRFQVHSEAFSPLLAGENTGASLNVAFRPHCASEVKEVCFAARLERRVRFRRFIRGPPTPSRSKLLISLPVSSNFYPEFRGSCVLQRTKEQRNECNYRGNHFEFLLEPLEPIRRRANHLPSCTSIAAGSRFCPKAVIPE